MWTLGQQKRREVAEAARAFDGDAGLDNLRREVLLVCVAAYLILPFLLMLVFSRPSETPSWLSSAILIVESLAWLTFLARGRSSALGGAVFCLGSVGLLSASLAIPSLGWAIHLLPLLVLFAATFFGLFGGLAIAALITAEVLILHAHGFSGAEFRLIMLLTWGNVAVAWCASEPVRLTLRWAIREYERAERETERARKQQAALAQAVKNLNVAQDRLELMNAELERARRAANTAGRHKAEFAATISHELRTPLNLIIGLSELMAAGPLHAATSDATTYQQDVDTIYRNARHLSSLIDDILDLAQVDAARMGLSRESTRLDDLIQEAVASVQPLFQHKGHFLAVNVDPNLPPVSVDRARIRQILINLLGNATRFIDSGGVFLNARVVERDVVVLVADTGIGIPPEEIGSVFEEFWQVPASGSRRLGHNGLGLTISKRLVELHGGSMWVESQLDVGTAFSFSLPLAENIISVASRSSWETWARPPAISEARDNLVVVFDDNPDTARLVQRYLDGYHVVAAGTWGDIRTLQQDYRLRAVILTGPTESELWRRGQQIRAHAQDLPVLLCPLPGLPTLAQDLGAVSYLVKPVLREQLARVLRPHGRFAEDVLVIDDDPDMVDLVTRMIQTISPRTTVRGVYGGAEGLAALRAHSSDLVLLDLLMPEPDGYTVIEAMRADEALRSIPVVVLSARGKQELLITGGMLGLTRGTGLSVAELMHMLKANLDALHTTESSNDPALTASLPG